MAGPPHPANDPEAEGAGALHRTLRDPDNTGDLAEALADIACEGLLVLGSDLRVRATNASYHRRFGGRPEGTVGRSVYTLHGGVWDHPRVRDLLERLLPHEGTVREYEAVLGPEGEVGGRTVTMNARSLPEHGLLLLAIEDVTGHHADVEALRANEEHYRSLFSSMDQGYCVIEMIYGEDGRPADYRFVEANPAFQAQTGLDEPLGRTARELVPGLEERWIETYGRVASTGEAIRFERCSEAMGRWFDVFASRVGGEGSDRVALLFTDVTAQRRAEEVRAESELRLRKLFQQAPAFIAVLRGPEHVFEFVNPAYLLLVGDRDLIGKPVREALPEIEGQGFFELLDEVYATGEAFTAVDRLVLLQRQGGEAIEERFVDFVYQPLRETDGTVGGIIALGVDTTERVRTREALNEANRELEAANEELEARVEQRTRQVRELASALTLAEQTERRRVAQVLHDGLQQQLYGVQLPLRVLEEELQGEDEALLELAARASRYVGEAIMTARHLMVDLSPPVLGDGAQGGSLREALEWLAAQMEERFGLRVELEGEDQHAVLNDDMRVLLFQTVRELLFNVVKHADTDGVRVSLQEEGDLLTIDVVDEGAGFDVATLKSPAPTGFGLYHARERLGLFGGRMKAASAPGEGTRITLTIPTHPL